MFACIDRMLEARERRGLIRDQRALIRAKTLVESQRAAFSGCQVVPAGHALVRPAGLQTAMDIVPVHESCTYRARGVHDTTSADVSRRPEVDIVNECTALGRAYALLAGQQLGKTYVARQIAARWAQEGHEIWFIGPKWCHGEWGPTVTMFGPDWPQIEEGLAALMIEAKQRREDAINGHRRTQDCSPRLIVIDDWTEVAQSLGEHAQRFVVSATTMFASVNLVPLFCGHADTSAAWGTDRVGKALTENFLRIRVHRHQDGSRQYGVLYPAQVERRKEGELIYPQYGFIPAGEPNWPHTAYAYRAEKHTEPVESAPQASMQPEYATLPRATPIRVRLKTERGKWRNVTVPSRTSASARRLFESSNSLAAVAEKLQLKGSKQTRLTLAAAVLGIPNNNYQILD